MSPAMHEQLQARIRRNVVAAVQLRDSTLMGRMHNGDGPLDIDVCLGPGRCLIPGADAAGLTCCFCVPYPTDVGSYRDADKVANRVIAGN
jgi:hypothetical protein